MALLSGAVAVASAVLASRTQLKLKSLDQAAARDAAKSEERKVLDRYRGPLLDAAWDLGDRIGNIIDRGFLAYLADESRRSVALSSTLFRVAQYFGWVEILRQEVQLLPFESANDTWRTTYYLQLVTRRFATDWYDWPEAHQRAEGLIQHYVAEQLPPHLFMLWQEEQRGVGERMIEGEGRGRCVGYASFIEDYDPRFEPLFADFRSHLQVPSVSKSLRLLELRSALARLVEQLDEEKRYVQGQTGYRSWLDAAHDSPCWTEDQPPVLRPR